jgi:hypothetical protein
MNHNYTQVGDATKFAIAFTFAVTESSANRRDWIAKKGKDSIFALLQEIYPEVFQYEMALTYYTR